MLHAAIRQAFERVIQDGRFESLRADDDRWAGWLQLFDDLVEMLGRSEAGEPPEEAFNPHMRALIPPTERHLGPGWDNAARP